MALECGPWLDITRLSTEVGLQLQNAAEVAGGLVEPDCWVLP